MSSWNPLSMETMSLPPCHVSFQFHVNTNKKELSGHLYQRSVDTFLGLPYNIASYSMLLNIIAKITGLTPGELVISTGSTHIYANHFDQVNTQLYRTSYDPPTISIDETLHDIDQLSPESITIHDYTYHPSIKAVMAV
jgi:thymidylate synthase